MSTVKWEFNRAHATFFYSFSWCLCRDWERKGASRWCRSVGSDRTTQEVVRNLCEWLTWLSLCLVEKKSPVAPQLFFIPHCRQKNCSQQKIYMKWCIPHYDYELHAANVLTHTHPWILKWRHDGLLKHRERKKTWDSFALIFLALFLKHCITVFKKKRREEEVREQSRTEELIIIYFLPARLTLHMC